MVKFTLESRKSTTLLKNVHMCKICRFNFRVDIDFAHQESGRQAYTFAILCTHAVLQSCSASCIALVQSIHKDGAKEQQRRLVQLIHKDGAKEQGKRQKKKSPERLRHL